MRCLAVAFANGHPAIAATPLASLPKQATPAGHDALGQAPPRRFHQRRTCEKFVPVHNSPFSRFTEPWAKRKAQWALKERNSAFDCLSSRALTSLGIWMLSGNTSAGFFCLFCSMGNGCIIFSCQFGGGCLSGQYFIDHLCDWHSAPASNTT
jgi:hypothetical protein